MVNPKNAAGWALAPLGAFLILDAVLAIMLGKRYMLWGLASAPDNYRGSRLPPWQHRGLASAPDNYRTLIEAISELPAAELLGIKVTEGAAGLGLLLFARKIITHRG